MLRLIVRQARPGMILARSVVNPQQPGQTLLAAGYTLNAYTIARLHELGAYDLWINYPGLEFLDDLYSPELTAQQQRVCETLQTSFQEQAQCSEAALPVHHYRTVVEDLVHAILHSVPSLPFISVLTGVENALLRHCSEVCVLGLMLGLRLDSYLVEQRKRRMNSRSAKDVVNLGLGCMLHDLGELQLPENLRESRCALHVDPNADNKWRRHTELGYSALRSQVDPSAATIALNHHQHFDGSGFPLAIGSENPQAGSDIHVFARIAMAADTFHHQLRNNGIPQPTISALWHIQHTPMRAWFDPIVLQALLAIVPPFVPGMVVILSDCRHAVVTRTFEDAPCYPEVQILESDGPVATSAKRRAPELVDLSTHPRLVIQSVDSADVTRFLYGHKRLVASPGAPVGAL